MSERTYDRLADLPLTVEGYRFSPMALELPGGFTRVTTPIWIGGAGEEGVGEDVCYDPADHQAMYSAGPVLPLQGTWTLRSFSEHLDGLDLFPAPPAFPFHLQYRRWAFESAALDLALRQAGLSLAEALGGSSRRMLVTKVTGRGSMPSASASDSPAWRSARSSAALSKAQRRYWWWNG